MPGRATRHCCAIGRLNETRVARARRAPRRSCAAIVCEPGRRARECWECRPQEAHPDHHDGGQSTHHRRSAPFFSGNCGCRPTRKFVDTAGQVNLRGTLTCVSYRLRDTVIEARSRSRPRGVHGVRGTAGPSGRGQAGISAGPIRTTAAPEIHTPPGGPINGYTSARRPQRQRPPLGSGALPDRNGLPW